MSLPSTVDGIHSITKTSHLNKIFFSVATKKNVSVSDADYGELSPKVIVIIMLIIIIIMITNLPKKEEDSAKEGDQLAGSQHGATLSALLQRYFFLQNLKRPDVNEKVKLCRKSETSSSNPA